LAAHTAHDCATKLTYSAMRKPPCPVSRCTISSIQRKTRTMMGETRHSSRSLAPVWQAIPSAVYAARAMLNPCFNQVAARAATVTHLKLAGTPCDGP
jgi:hypothetical protein